MSNQITLYEDDELSNGQEFARQASRRLISPFSKGLNVDLSAMASFSGAKAPLSDFENEAINDLERDLFWTLYQFRYDLHETPPEGREITRQLLDFVLLDPQFDSKRMLLIGRQVSSAAMAYVIALELMEDPDFGGAMGKMGKAERMQQQAEDLRDRAQNPQPPEHQEQEDQQDGDSDSDDDEDQELQGSFGGSGLEDEMSPEEMESKADELEQQAQDIQEQAQSQMDKGMNRSLAPMIRSGAVQEGSSAAEEIGNFLSSWGVEEGQGLELSIEEIRELMKMMSTPGLANLTQLMGRAYGTAVSVISGRSPMQVMVTTGGRTKLMNDIYYSELAMMSRKAPASVRGEYTKRYLEGGLSGAARTSQAKTEGAFIWAVDGSSSMEDLLPMGGESKGMVSQHVIAKALSLGLARAAQDNGQEFHMFSFSSAGQISDLVSHRSSMADLLKFAVFDFNGGTNYDSAMNTMMDVFENLDEEDRLMADIGITTDGQGGVEQATVERLEYIKERWKCRFHILLIGDASNDALEPLADNVLQFTSLQDIAEILSKAIWQ